MFAAQLVTKAMSIMAGFTPVKRGAGELHWKGRKVKPSAMIRYVGVVMQDPSQYFITPTVLDELVMGRKNKTPDDVRRVLAAVGLTDISLVSHPKSLSGGQVRRLALASQLMREPLPELFLLDEPLAGVDWTAREDLVRLLASLKSQFSVVIVSHEPGDLLEYADRVVEVSRGGMHDISTEVIVKAIEVRVERNAMRRAKALEDAAEYMRKKHGRKQI